MEVRIMKISDSSFIGDDGKEVVGKHIYVMPVMGGNMQRLFFSADRLLNMSYDPVVGDVVYVVVNELGRTVELLKLK